MVRISRCNCDSPSSCGCAAEAGDLGDLTVTGVGSVGDPFVIDDPSFQRVATTAARDSIGSPQEGWISYVLATDLYYRYTGSAWQPWDAQRLFFSRLTVAAATMDFTAINQEFNHLEGQFQVKSTAAVGQVEFRVRVNGASGASDYEWQRVTGQGATAAASQDTGDPSVRIGTISDASSQGGAPEAGAGTFQVPNYTATTFWKQILGNTIAKGATENVTEQAGGRREATAAMTNLTFLASSGSLDVGSTISGAGRL